MNLEFQSLHSNGPSEYTALGHVYVGILKWEFKMLY